MSDYELVIKETLIETLKRSNNPLIIYPAAKAGQMLFHSCCKDGLKIEAFCDDGAMRNKYVCDTPVYCLEDILLRYPNAEFIIAFEPHETLVKKIESHGSNKWYLGLVLFDRKDLDFRKNTKDFIVNLTLYGLEMNREIQLNHYRNFSSNYIYQLSAGINNTILCNLRCKNCQQLQSYVKNPRHYDFEKQKEVFEQYMGLVDEIYQFELCGGECFTDPSWPKYVEMILPYLGNKIKLFTMTSNGKITPKEEDLHWLSHARIYVKISDYPHIREKQKKSMSIYKENQIWHSPVINSWFEVKIPQKNNRTAEENQRIFDVCECKKDPVIHSDVGLQKCNIWRILKEVGFDFPDVDGDRLDFQKMIRDGIPRDQIKKAINDYLNCDEAMSLCDYCYGHSYDTEFKRVLPGEQ